jgi:hypothetical protein
VTVGTLSPDEKNLYTIVFAIRQLQEGRSNATTREVLSAARTYFVRADGSDGNDGKADSTSRAFLTLQKAIDAALDLDLNGFAVTIQVRGGTFAGFTLSVPFVGGLVTIVGDPTTPANVIINSGIIVQNGATIASRQHIGAAIRHRDEHHDDVHAVQSMVARPPRVPADDRRRLARRLVAFWPGGRVVQLAQQWLHGAGLVQQPVISTRLTRLSFPRKREPMIAGLRSWVPAFPRFRGGRRGDDSDLKQRDSHNRDKLWREFWI